MSNKGNASDLLINFDNLSFDDDTNDLIADIHASHSGQQAEETAPMASMPFMCSTTPIYKLLGSSTIDLNDNNPFDQLDKRANLSDDPFEIVENAACANSSKQRAECIVETGTLISLDSPTLTRDELVTVSPAKPCDTPKSVQNATQKTPTGLREAPTKPQSGSPSGRTRNKTRPDSLSLLKYSFSNSRTEPNGDNASPTAGEDLPGDEQMAHKHKMSMLAMRRNSNDDSFDDIWSTKPNLIDSQTDIDIDFDSDIAELNIPMLVEPKAQQKSPESTESTTLNETVDDAKEHKHVHRNDLLVKLASIKQNNLSSPVRATVRASISPVQGDPAADAPAVEQPLANADEPFYTPKSHFSAVRPEHLMTANNPNSLIDNLRHLVNQCDDELQQSEAKNLLDNLSSLLTKEKAPGLGPRSNTFTELKPLKRQNTFNIDDEKPAETGPAKDTSAENGKQAGENVATDELISIGQADEQSDAVEAEQAAPVHDAKITTAATGPDYSDIVRQIQAVLGAQQNINVLQPNAQQQNALNPIILVIPQTNEVRDSPQAADARHVPLRARSRSLNLKEKPIAALKAMQAKNELQQRQSALPTTPSKRAPVLRRSSFGVIQRPAAPSSAAPATQLANVFESQGKATANAAALRRRSLQTLPTDAKVPAPVQAKGLAALNRRRSFQSATSASSGVRSPSPKPSAPSTSNLTRRRSFNSPLSAKDTPQKLKTSYGIMRKPTAPPTNLKIRVTQALGSKATGSSTRAAPMKAVVPMKCVATAATATKEHVSPADSKRDKSLITSTPRNFAIPKPSGSIRKGMRIQSVERHWPN